MLGASLPKSETAGGLRRSRPGPRSTRSRSTRSRSCSFQAKSFDVPGGINLIKYIDKGGTHTLVFDENAVPGFELAVPQGRAAAKVDLTPNATYVIYCTIPGHRAAGMEADLNVGAARRRARAGHRETDDADDHRARRTRHHGAAGRPGVAVEHGRS